MHVSRPSCRMAAAAHTSGRGPKKETLLHVGQGEREGMWCTARRHCRLVATYAAQASGWVSAEPCAASWSLLKLGDLSVCKVNHTRACGSSELAG